MSLNCSVACYKCVRCADPGIVFVVYSEVIRNMPVPTFWAVSFFFFFICVAMDSQVSKAAPRSHLGRIDSDMLYTGSKNLTCATACLSAETLFQFITKIIYTIDADGDPSSTVCFKKEKVRLTGQNNIAVFLLCQKIFLKHPYEPRYPMPALLLSLCQDTCWTAVQELGLFE